MPANPDIQNDRRTAIVNMLAEQTISTQAEVVARLRAAGFDATQSSISRDFRVLGVQKTPLGYSLPQTRTEDKREFDDAAQYLRDVRLAGGHLVVVKTAIGAAQRVALAIDRADWPEIIGTVSGDDTIFVATASQADSRNILRRLTSSRTGTS